MPDGNKCTVKTVTVNIFNFTFYLNDDSSSHTVPACILNVETKRKFSSYVTNMIKKKDKHKVLRQQSANRFKMHNTYSYFIHLLHCVKQR